MDATKKSSSESGGARGEGGAKGVLGLINCVNILPFQDLQPHLVFPQTPMPQALPYTAPSSYSYSAVGPIRRHCCSEQRCSGEGRAKSPAAPNLCCAHHGNLVLPKVEIEAVKLLVQDERFVCW